MVNSEQLITNYNQIFSYLDNRSSYPNTQLLFSLKELFTNTKSVLLRHEAVYVLGQLELLESIPFLISVANDQIESEVTRHEAIESIGSIIPHLPSPSKIESQIKNALISYCNEESRIISETSLLTLSSITFPHPTDTTEIKKTKTVEKGKNKYDRLDPVAPSTTDYSHMSLQNLIPLLVNTNQSLPAKYRVLAALRDKGEEAGHILCKFIRGATDYGKPSALMKHEVCFMLGQISSGESVETLLGIVKDCQEEDVVRHEAAISIGTIVHGSDDIDMREMVRKEMELIMMMKEVDDLVKESCVVAMDKMGILSK